ncbi:uncharacterized protein FYW47_013955 [Aplochiton taeniatus]
MARLSEHGIRLSSMSPSFLNSNSTSHTWPFSAVAELIDNASDPGVTAKQIWIDVGEEEDQLCLTFTDNGSGMTPSKLHKMLSFGFTEKGSGKASHMAIGVYGNGFKSGSMRLGRDALIFTKNGGCQSVGMLSQSYLKAVKAQAVIVPIAPFNQQTNTLVVTEDSEASLEAILSHSLISSKEKLLQYFDSIPSKKGTKILIWNVRRNKDGKPELDYETDEFDIRVPDLKLEEQKKTRRSSTGPQRRDNILPEMDYSLRAYLSILYLKPTIQIILRKKKVLTRLVAKSLSHIENDVYKPNFIKERVKVTFGFNGKNKEHYGIMMYHKNRLIKSYEKVGFQIKSSGQRAGVGVIGVIECNFLRPAHNKQDFEYTKEYRLALAALGLKLNDYWREMMEKRAREREFRALQQSGEEEEEEKCKMGAYVCVCVCVSVSVCVCVCVCVCMCVCVCSCPQWLQCEECLKWRSVPSGHYSTTPDHWSCDQNPNPRLRSCSVPEEVEESEEELAPSYQKTYKKQEKTKSRKRGRSSRGRPPKHHNCPRGRPGPLAVRPPDDQPAPVQDDSSLLDGAPPVDEHRLNPPLEDTAELSLLDELLTEEDAANTTMFSFGEAGEPDDARPPGDVCLTPELAHPQEEAACQRDKEQAGQERPAEEGAQTRQGEEGGEQEMAATTEEGGGETSQNPSNKRQASWPPRDMDKRQCLWAEPIIVSEETGEEMPPGKDATEPAEMTKRDSTSRVEKTPSTRLGPSQPSSSLAWTHPTPSTQTVMVSPLSRSEGLRSRTMSSEGGDREAMVQKLASLEKETQRLRRMLALSTTPPEETTATGSLLSEKLMCGEETSAVDVAARLDTQQARTPEKASGPRVEKAAQSQGDVAGQKVEPEKGKLQRGKADTPSRLRSRDSALTMPDDVSLYSSRSVVQENLRCLRGNVVALLSAILPHLDLAGISLESADIDSILQQIIDANSLSV